MKVPRSFRQYDDKARENDPGGVLSAEQSAGADVANWGRFRSNVKKSYDATSAGAGRA